MVLLGVGVNGWFVGAAVVSAAEAAMRMMMGELHGEKSVVEKMVDEKGGFMADVQFVGIGP